MVKRLRLLACAAAGLVATAALAATWTADVLAQDDVTEGLIDVELGDGGDLTHPVLGAHLSALADEVAADRLGGSAATPHMPGDTGNFTVSMIGLSITFDGDSAPVVKAITDNGGDVRNVFDGYIEAYVAPSALAALARVPGLTWAREFAQPHKDRGEYTSGGVAAHLADAWHAAGITGRGVKVGVIDTATSDTSRDGFSGLHSAIASGDLPSTVKGRCYKAVNLPTSDLGACAASGGDSHGTRVAATLMDVAPDAGLYISNPMTWGDLQRSVEWMKNQGVKVIAHSVSWNYHGAADGTSPVNPSPLNTVKWAADNGIVWINSAGNYNGGTWFGAFADADNDNIHEWTTGDEYQEFTLGAGETRTVFMRWDDNWGGASKDLALHVVKNPGTAGEQLVDNLNDPQSGGASHRPFEGKKFKAPVAGTYAFVVKKLSGTAPSWIQLATFDSLAHTTTGHSLLSPADSAHNGMLAVGAAWSANSSIRGFSSLGPTPDGRVKPDIVGADGYVSLGATRFGTSYSAPHVAGLAALVRQQNPAFTPEQTTEYLKAHAAPRGEPNPNNTYGHGFAQLPSLDCTEPLNGDGSASGSWTTNCMSVTDTEKSSQYYTFTISQQSTVTIGLSSSVDSYLYLRRGYNNQKSAALHTDDDSGAGSDARISESLAAGTYTIEATTLATGRTGAFTLTVSGGLETLPEISITAASTVTEGDTAVFTLTASPAPAAALPVRVAVTAAGDFGVTPGSQTVTVPTSGSATLSITTTGDTEEEADGSVTASISSGRGYTVSAAAAAATVAVEDDDEVACTTQLHSDAISRARAAYAWHAANNGNSQVRFWQILAYLDADPMPAAPNGTTPAPTTVAAVETFSSGKTWPGWKRIVKAMQCHIPAPATPEVSITAGSGVTEGADAAFTLTANPAPAAALTVTVAVTQTGGYITPGSHTVTIPTSGSATLAVATVNDSVDEADGSVTATVNAGTGYTVSSTAGSASVAVADDDVPEVAITAGAAAVEGGDATFTLTAAPAPAAALSVTVAVTQSGDFIAPGSRTVTIPVSGSATLSVATVNDSVDEANGSVTATVDAGTGYTVSSSAGSATVTVSDDDATTTPVTDDPCFEHLTGDGNSQGEWTKSCTSNERDGRYARFYTFELGQQSTVTIDLDGTVDNFLYLREGMNVAQGRALHYNDDRRAGNLDALIRASLPSGWYSIEATTYSRARTGTFNLRISGLPAAPAAPATPELSITAGAAVIEGTDAEFTLTAAPAPAAALTVTVAVTQSGDFITPGSHTVTIPASGSATLSIPTTGDTADESDGSVTATINTGAGYTISSTAGSATVDVSDDDASAVCTVQLPSDAVTVAEVTGWRDGHSGTAHVLRWNRVLAALGVDTGETEMTVSESRANEYQFMASRWDRVTRTLEALAQCNNPPPATPEVGITAGSAVIEGTDATFTLTADPAPTAALSVSVAVTQTGDYITPSTQTVTIPASGSATLTVATANDTTDEADGSVTATINAGNGYTVSTTAGSATVDVSDNDDPVPPPTTPEVSITAGGDITEGDTATFTVVADPAPTTALSVGIAITQSGDFAVGAGMTVAIPTSGSASVSVATLNDGVDEADGSVTATINSGQGYTVSATAGSATVTVADDDPVPPPRATPEVSVTASSGITEGADAVFTLTADPAPASPLAVTVNVAQSGDYGVATGSQTVTIPTSGSYTLTIATSDDSTDEADGSVTVTVNSGAGYSVSATAASATAAVFDDDNPAPPPPVADPGFSIEDASGTEGEQVSVRVTLSHASSQRLRVYWTTRYGGSSAWDHRNPIWAMDGADFAAARGWLTFEPGVVERQAQVNLLEDSRVEPAEEFQVHLMFVSPYGAVPIADGIAIVTITDND